MFLTGEKGEMSSRKLSWYDVYKIERVSFCRLNLVNIFSITFPLQHGYTLDNLLLPVGWAEWLTWIKYYRCEDIPFKPRLQKYRDSHFIRSLVPLRRRADGMLWACLYKSLRQRTAGSNQHPGEPRALQQSQERVWKWIVVQPAVAWLLFQLRLVQDGCERFSALGTWMSYSRGN